jgi:hypothetical protein
LLVDIKTSLESDNQRGIHTGLITLEGLVKSYIRSEYDYEIISEEEK